MSKKHLYSLWILLIGIFFGHANTYAQQIIGDLVLVSSTDFSAEGAEELEFTSASSINDFGGICPTEITIGEEFKLTPDTKSSTSESTFLSGMHYGISKDSRRLDSLRFAAANDDWGIVFSPGEKNLSISKRTLLLNYKVKGLKDNGKYKVVVDYCNPLSEDFLNAQSNLNIDSRKNGGPYFSSYNSTIEIGINNTMPDGFHANMPIKSADCNTTTITITSPLNYDSRANAIMNGCLDVNIYMYMATSYSALKIKSIKVYSEIDPIIIGKTSDCMGGKNVPFKLSDSYSNCTYQWFKDNNPIAGATKSTYTHTTGNTEGEHVFYCEIKTPDGTKIKSQPLYFTDKVCCVDGDENPADEKLIWQDDFGTFTEEGHYWVWDYSDINNPKKVEKTTPDGWTYELPYQISGAEYQSVVYQEGTYSVAANVTCAWDNAKTGTMWEWQAYTFYGASPKSYGKEYAPDHTSSMENAPEGYGAMLFLNCGNEPDEVLYERTIMGLCNKSMTAKCHISTWAASDYPVKIKIRVTDLNSGESYTSETVERKSSHEDFFIYNVQTAWDEVSVPFDLTGDNPSLKLEIISEAGGLMNNKEGNDLILDDIQIWECSAPNVKLSFENNEIINDTITCSGDYIALFAEQTTMIENYYRDDAAYIYQYTFENPLDNNSWKPVPGSGITKDAVIKKLDEVFKTNDLNDKVYFRVVLGLNETLKSLGLDYPYNPNDVCAAYSVSNTIVATINCPSCTKPKDIKIKSSKTPGLTQYKGKDVVELCYGESVTLSQAEDITPNEEDWEESDFAGFAIKWFENGNKGSMRDAQTVLNGKISDKVITFDDHSLEGTSMKVVLYAVDALYLDGSCYTADTVYIKFNETPTDVLRQPKAEFCEGAAGPNDVSLQLMYGDYSDYTIKWWYAGATATDTADAQKLRNNLDNDWFEGRAPKESGIYLYQLISKDSPYCKGDVNEYELTVNVVPEAPLEESIQYTVTGEKEPLGTEKFNQTVTTDPELLWYSNFDRTIVPDTYGMNTVFIDKTTATPEGIPYVYYIAYFNGNCYSERAKVEVTVSPNTEAVNVVANDDEIINVYTITGALVKSNVKRSEALNGLANGTYLVGSQKVVVNK